MSYHEINLFNDEGPAMAKAAQHRAAGRTNVAVTPRPGYESVIVYDNTDGKAEVIFDKDGPPNLYLVESDGA